MTLILKNADMEGLIPMPRLVEDMEIAFQELGSGIAETGPRVDVRAVSPGNPNDAVQFNTMQGIVPGLGVAALRFYFSHRLINEVEGAPRVEYAGDYPGLLLLLDLATCRVLAILDDHYQSPLRVAATSAVGAKYLARPDAGVLGMLGSGEQAKAQLLAMTAVRPIKEVRVYSPNPAHRRAFAETMTRRLDVEIRAVDSAREAVEGADIVNCATNSYTPCFDGAWLSPGAHVSLLIVGSSFQGASHEWATGEVDETTYLRSARIGVTMRRDLEESQQGYLYRLLEDGRISRSSVSELGELATGAAHGRVSSDEITVFGNNRGQGMQFAVSARIAYEEAGRRGIGSELPDELFYTDRRGGIWSP